MHQTIWCKTTGGFGDVSNTGHQGGPEDDGDPLGFKSGVQSSQRTGVAHSGASDGFLATEGHPCGSEAALGAALAPSRCCRESTPGELQGQEVPGQRRSLDSGGHLPVRAGSDARRYVNKPKAELPSGIGFAFGVLYNYPSTLSFLRIVSNLDQGTINNV